MELNLLVVAVIALVALAAVLIVRERAHAQRERAHAQRERARARRVLFYEAVGGLQLAVDARVARSSPSEAGDTVRPGARPVHQDDLAAWLDGLSRAPEASTAAAWARVRQSGVLPADGAPETDGARLEVAADGATSRWPLRRRPPPTYHAALVAVLNALAPVWGSSYRIFHERNIFGGAARPDFIIACRKEAMATGTNALVMVEVKHPDKVDGLASMQLERYILWRLKQLVGDLERSGAGARELASLHGVGLLTCVKQVQLTRVHLNVRVDEERVDVVVARGEWLPLVVPGSVEPTRGFKLLAALLGATASELGEIEPVPAAVVSPDGAEMLPVIEHLGSGGFSDVFRVELDGAPVAVKRPRHSDANQRAQLCTEASILLRLSSRGSVHVPALVPRYAHVREPASLALACIGTQVDTRADELGARERVRFANRVAAALLHALQAAHSLRICHNDVRPPNAIVSSSTDDVVLIDWGLAKDFGHARPFDGKDFAARCIRDCICACLVGLFLAGPSKGSQLVDVWGWHDEPSIAYWRDSAAFSPEWHAYLSALVALQADLPRVQPAALERFYAPW